MPYDQSVTKIRRFRQSEETTLFRSEIPLSNRLPRDMTKTALTTPHPPEGSAFMRRQIATFICPFGRQGVSLPPPPGDPEAQPLTRGLTCHVPSFPGVMRTAPYRGNKDHRPLVAGFGRSPQIAAPRTENRFV